MIKRETKKFFLAFSTLIGTTVGAGIFALPYVIFKSGFLPGIFYLVLLGTAVALLHLFYGEIVLRTKEKHRLVGYCQRYLGNWSKNIVGIAAILGLVGSILVYIILGADFLRIIFGSFLPLISFGRLGAFLSNPAWLGFCFWLFLSYFVFKGIKLIARVELLMNVLLFLAVLLILVFALPHLSWQNFPAFNASHFFLPYGAVLFSFIALSAVPEIGDILETKDERKKYKRVIIASSVIVFVLYLLFSLIIVGVSGSFTSPDALQGLTSFLGKKIIVLGAFFGLIAVATSFLILGNYFKNILVYDYNFPKVRAAILACLLPFCLFLLGFRNFIGWLSFVGCLAGAFEGVMLILVYRKAKKSGNREPEYNLQIQPILLYLLMAIFIGGAIAQVVYFIKS